MAKMISALKKFYEINAKNNPFTNGTKKTRKFLSKTDIYKNFPLMFCFFNGKFLIYFHFSRIIPKTFKNFPRLFVRKQKIRNFLKNFQKIFAIPEQCESAEKLNFSEMFRSKYSLKFPQSSWKYSQKKNRKFVENSQKIR